MKVTLKKLNEQVVVITGASSGIGLVTARAAAKEGAKLVLASRSEEALRQLRDEINQAGGQAIHVVADVSQSEDVQRIAQAAEGQGREHAVDRAIVDVQEPSGHAPPP